MSELTHRSQLLTAELSSYASREPEFILAQKTIQGKLDRAEIEVKRLTRQCEAARKKADFLESQAGGGPPATTAVQPLQIAHGIMNQSSGGAARTDAGGVASYLQPIPFAQSLLPPTFGKKV